MRVRRFTLPPGLRLRPAVLALSLIGMPCFDVSVGQALQLSRIPDLITSEDTPTQIVPFTISGAARHDFTVTVASSEPWLVPEANVTLSGAGTGRALLVTPAANQSGEALLQLRVTDGCTVVTQAFRVTVTAVNDAPTISRIPDQFIPESAATTAISFTIGDVETPAASLIVTASSSNTNVIANEALILSGTGSTRTIVARATSGKSGATTITLVVSDGEARTSARFQVTVGRTNRAPLANAGPGQTLLTTNTTVLNGTATDDLCPAEKLVTTWSVVSGVGSVTFSNPAALNTTVSFGRPGIYVLRLTAFDGEVSGSDDVTVVVGGDRFAAAELMGQKSR
jgi:hypothetical protein